MANRVLTIVAKVKDAASAGLDRIQNSLKRTGGAAKQTSMDFTQFNKVMFSTTAYIGFFNKAFTKFGDVLFKGAEFGRVSDQFERVLGPKGDLFSAISGMTDNSIDKVEAMRSAIQLKTLGIATNTNQIAELIARAGTAGKLAGKDSAEGIKEFTHFLKDGSLAQLESLNLLATNNPALKLQMSLIAKMGGVMGSAMTAQMKYNMGLRLLRSATDGALKGQRDLYDVIFDLKQSFTLLKNEIGIFLGTSLASIMEKATKAADKFSTMLEYIRENKKEVLFLAKALITLGGALSGLMAGAGTFRLLAKGLQALGISAMPLIGGVGILLSLFSALTYQVKEGTTPIERFVEKIRVFGAVLKGIYQLVSSYITNQDNMRKGIGQMDKDLYELLNKNGLFVFVHRVSQVISALSRFGIEVFKQLVTWAKELDDLFGSLGNKFAEIFGVNKKLEVDLDATGNVIDEPHVKRMSAFWLAANSKSYQLLKKGAAALLTAFMAYKIFGIGKGFLSHIPLLGRLMGKAGTKPDGSKTNPLHVVVDNNLMKAFGEGRLLKQLATMAKNLVLGKEIAGPVAEGAKGLGRAGGLVETLGVLFRGAFMRVWISVASRLMLIKDVITGVISSFEGLTAAAAAFRALSIIYVAASAFGFLVGVVEGMIENFDKFTNMFSSIYDYMRSIDYGGIFSDIANVVGDVMASIARPFEELGSYIYDKLAEGFDLIAPYVQSVLTPIGEAFDRFKGWLDVAGQALKGFYDWLANLPVVGELIKATTRAVLHPYDNMKDAGNMVVGLAGMAADSISNSARNATAKNLLDNAQGGQGQLMFTPSTPEDRADYAMRAVKQTSGMEHDRMARALREATLGTSAGGREITPEEWARIFGFALDNSKVAKHTKDTATEVKDGKKTALTSRRGGC